MGVVKWEEGGKSGKKREERQRAIYLSLGSWQVKALKYFYSRYYVDNDQLSSRLDTPDVHFPAHTQGVRWSDSLINSFEDSPLLLWLP